MIIPKLHYISQGNSPKEHLENIQKACTSGIELVQLGLKNVSDKKMLKFAQEAREITAHFQTRLIISDHYKLTKEVKADGVFLEQKDLCPTLIREQLYPWQMIGGTANTLQDCEALMTKEVDYICLGPFRSATTENNASADLGLNGYTAIIEILNSDTPIIGVGGISIADVAAILETGVSGLAISEEITRNFDSIRTFNQLLNASSTEEQRYTFE
ncbi:Thiamine-phosphate synthase [Arenibacter antarcticus]|uniref:Thiamine phosphate synthase n=1 Tax=Arenibacter antarcticus TaxID=2040469 RepID=A0ABW5VJW5_9FLAO|nr:thiamine phosphate synthase [Arenibacter sp. H213]MCM4166313.1 thiamine phosphate synthase [Arenibacter sp. H213]